MILVTGATGFLGSYLVAELIKKKYDLRLLCRDVQKAKNMFPEAEVIKGDITEPDSLKGVSKDVDTLIHNAAIIAYNRGRETIMRINVDGTRNILDKSQEVERIIFASSVAVYGKQKGLLSEQTPVKPDNNYARSKAEAEKLVMKSGIPYIAHRISVIYGIGGPRIESVIRMIDRGFPVPKTENKTDLIHVSDVSRAFELSLKRGSGIYNIASGNSVKITDFAQIIADELGVKLRKLPERLELILATLLGKGEELKTMIKDRNYDISKARSELGFKPQAVLEKELIKTVRNYKKTKKTKKL